MSFDGAVPIPATIEAQVNGSLRAAQRRDLTVVEAPA
jgi:hypothetical protein